MQRFFRRLSCGVSLAVLAFGGLVGPAPARAWRLVDWFGGDKIEACAGDQPCSQHTFGSTLEPSPISKGAVLVRQGRELLSKPLKVNAYRDGIDCDLLPEGVDCDVYGEIVRRLGRLPAGKPYGRNYRGRSKVENGLNADKAELDRLERNIVFTRAPGSLKAPDGVLSLCPGEPTEVCTVVWLSPEDFDNHTTAEDIAEMKVDLVGSWGEPRERWHAWDKPRTMGGKVMRKFGGEHEHYFLVKVDDPSSDLLASAYGPDDYIQDFEFRISYDYRPMLNEEQDPHRFYIEHDVARDLGYGGGPEQLESRPYYTFARQFPVGFGITNKGLVRPIAGPTS